MAQKRSSIKSSPQGHAAPAPTVQSSQLPSVVDIEGTSLLPVMLLKLVAPALRLTLQHPSDSMGSSISLFERLKCST